MGLLIVPAFTSPTVWHPQFGQMHRVIHGPLLSTRWPPHEDSVRGGSFVRDTHTHTHKHTPGSVAPELTPAFELQTDIPAYMVPAIE